MIRLNEIEITPTLFPDGTSQIWHLDIQALKGRDDYTIEWRFEHEDEFLWLAQLKMLLDTFDWLTLSNLDMPYLPYGRQDKVVSNDSTFALHTFAKLINSLHFSKVYVNDAHSKIALLLIENVRSRVPIDRIKDVYDKLKADLVCYPDEGAITKYKEILPMLHIYGHKKREEKTGKITGYQVYGDVSEKIVLIVDDICDGGSTFLHLSERLHEKGAREVHLYVSHGIFSQGLKILREAGIKRIFTYEKEMS
jgi:ribose-phosphate pyrophosphokinase